MSDEQVGLVFGALADPTRRAILRRLTAGDATVGELAEPFPFSLTAVSKHIKVLEQAGLVQRRRVWREQHISLTAAPLSQAQGFIDDLRMLWARRLDSLEAALAEDADNENADKNTKPRPTPKPEDRS